MSTADTEHEEDLKQAAVVLASVAYSVAARDETTLNDLGVTIEVANQARVHLWYPGHFGCPYPALGSAEDGISRFLVRESCVGVRPRDYVSPYGLSGLYAGTLTPNPATPYPELFDTKVASYKARWDWLTVERGT